MLKNARICLNKTKSLSKDGLRGRSRSNARQPKFRFYSQNGALQAIFTRLEKNGMEQSSQGQILFDAGTPKADITWSRSKGNPNHGMIKLLGSKSHSHLRLTSGKKNNFWMRTVTCFWEMNVNDLLNKDHNERGKIVLSPCWHLSPHRGVMKTCHQQLPYQHPTNTNPQRFPPYEEFHKCLLLKTLYPFSRHLKAMQVSCRQ